jgi:F-type H+-transporting ATPase subunit b
MNWSQWRKDVPPYVAMLVNFGILIAGYYLLGKKPIAAALQNRRDSIARDIDEAQKMRLEAEQRAKVYQAKLEKLEDEVKTARDALVRAGEAERDRIVGDAEAKAERMRKDAEFLVEQELKQIRLDLWKSTVETAVSTAEELLKKRVTPADQERIAEDYLADLGGKKAAPVAGAGTQESTP